MNINALFGMFEADSRLIDSNDECEKAFGYEELHLTDEVIDKIKNGNDLVVQIQAGEYILRISYGGEE